MGIGADGRIEVLESAPGDGIVLRESAVGDERPGQRWRPELDSGIRWSRAIFLPSDHLGITLDPVFTDNVLFELLEAPRPR